MISSLERIKNYVELNSTFFVENIIQVCSFNSTSYFVSKSYICLNKNTKTYLESLLKSKIVKK